MSKRYGKATGRKRKKFKEFDNTILFLEYHDGAFAYFHSKLEEIGYSSASFHQLRSDFWSTIEEGIYDSDNGKKLINDYLNLVESEVKKIIEKKSLAYWIHLIRRIACVLSKYEIDDDTERIEVIGLVRCIFEAMIQKYSSIGPCNNIGFSNQIKIEEILNGFFSKHELIDFGKAIMEKPQLVLTHFDLDELIEFYELEKLIYEIWRCSANFRGLAKGSQWAVTHNPIDAGEVRDEILSKSLKIFDTRTASLFHFEAHVTAKGTLYELKNSDQDEKKNGTVFIPLYNVGRINVKKLIEGMYKISLSSDLVTNFIWIPINIRNYYKSNLSYSEEFFNKNNVDLESVLAVYLCILIRVSDQWNSSNEMIFRYWKRGYEGPYKNEYIVEQIEDYLPIAIDFLQLKKTNINLDEAIKFWTLNEAKQEIIDATYPGPHSIFLPFGKDRTFIDYAWMYRRLYDLFWNCKIDDENFKGEALELFVIKNQKLALPNTPLKNINGEKRQIDASFQFENKLLIIECKVFSRSIGFDRGNKEAIQYRKDKYAEAIEQVEEKIEWLIENKEGTNFNIRKYSKIIGVVITPFPEYIRVDERQFWLTEKIPRILTSFELIEFLDNNKIWEADENVFEST